MSPTWRKPAGMLLILLLIVGWAGLVASLSGPIGRLPTLVQTVIYCIAGIIWIVPLGPLLRWMELGRWRN